jgi:hypothetical protein
MKRVLSVVLVLALFVVALRARGDAAPAYVVIVNPRNPASTVDRAFLADAFLKKTVSWPNGDVIRPADLTPGSPARRRFTADVLRRSIDEVKVYWQQRIFSGRDVPPPELDRDEDVIRYVLRFEGGVGYVSPAAPLAGAKVIDVR